MTDEVKIEVRLANGLAALKWKIRLIPLLAAGMGGRLISEVLVNGRAKLGSTPLRFAAHNREDELQYLAGIRFLFKAGGYLEEAFEEILVAEADKANF